jgi:hypothetical protein
VEGPAVSFPPSSYWVLLGKLTPAGLSSHANAEDRTLQENGFFCSLLGRTQEYAGNVVVLRCIPYETVKVNHDGIQ